MFGAYADPDPDAEIGGADVVPVVRERKVLFADYPLL
jgi:hypothetical protein